MRPTVYYHTASWCSPCKTLKPKVAKLCNELGVAMKVIDIDTDKPIVSGFSSVPAVVVKWPTRDGELLLVGQTLTIPALRKALS